MVILSEVRLFSSNIVTVFKNNFLQTMLVPFGSLWNEYMEVNDLHIVATLFKPTITVVYS